MKHFCYPNGGKQFSKTLNLLGFKLTLLKEKKDS